MSKVFGIGFHKTGTTSLAAALRRLGFATCDGAAALRESLGQSRLVRGLYEHRLDPVFEIAARYDAFTDVPWFMLYRELDARFPGSKFILTARAESRWLDSAVRYFGHSESSFRRWIYGSGSPIGNEEQWLGVYRRHCDEVRSYFAGREDDLLVVDWERGNGWRELAAFLDRPAPAEPFPRLTKPRAAAPDLTGAIVVLTHPRTGSSLLMQTLQLLGAPIAGTVHRDDMPAALNPKGFFEHPGVLLDGLYAHALRETPDLLRGRAVKISLEPLVCRALDEEWAWIVSAAAVLIPIREPAEQLVSVEGLLGEVPAARRARFVREASRNYLMELGYLAERISANGHSRAAPVCIEYRQAIEDPAGYVRTVAQASRLSPTPPQMAAAAANIDRGLHRHRTSDPGPASEAAKGFAALTDLYDILRGQDPLKWTRLLEALPPWVFASGRT